MVLFWVLTLRLQSDDDRSFTQTREDLQLRLGPLRATPHLGHQLLFPHLGLQTSLREILYVTFVTWKVTRLLTVSNVINAIIANLLDISSLIVHH
ncbi:hypothetical protein LINPERPRIM_LOCUS36805 [Linum perenne]